MSNTYIIDQLLKLHKQELVSFHMPGHKNGRLFDRFNYKNFKDVLPYLDTTEIPGTDNLHKPMEVIKKSQQRASEVFKSEETFFLVNGSTAGIYSMIMAATSPGDKLIINRNCHQSVINAMILGNCSPIFINPEMDIHQGFALGISPERVEAALKEHPEAKAVVITYPTYYGMACDLKKIAETVHKYDKILLVDEAHGAHLGLSDKLPPTALECGADVVVQSTHKTLPAFTQSSMLHIQGSRIDREKLRFMLRLHQSSSPSYVLLASLELALMIYDTQGKYLMENLLEQIDDFNYKAKKQGILYTTQNTAGQGSVYATDPTKLWLSLQHRNITGYQLGSRLREEYSIQMELSNLYGTLGIATIGNIRGDFDRLHRAVEAIAKVPGNTKLKDLPPFTFRLPEAAYSPRQAVYMHKRQFSLEESEGCVSGEYIIPYPPGIPLLIPGEIINHEIIHYIKVMLKEGMEIVGLKDETCQTIDVID